MQDNRILNFIKENKILILIFILFLTLRFINLQDFLWMDETGRFVQTFLFTSIFNQKIDVIPHLPFALSIYKLSTILFNGEFRAMRLVPLLFSIGNFFLIYKLCIQLYNSKKIGLWAILLYSICYYPFLSSVQIDQDGAINSFFLLMSMFLYVKYIFKGFSSIGIAICLSLITASRPVLGIVGLAVVAITHICKVNNEGLKGRFSNFGKKYGGLLRCIILYFILSGGIIVTFYKIFPDLVVSSLQRLISISSNFTTFSISPFFHIALLAMYATPLILLAFLGFKNMKKHIVVMVPIILLFVYVLIAKGGDLPRYFMPAIPYLVIIFAYYIHEFIPTKSIKVISGIAISAVGCMVYNFYINYSNIPLGMNDFLAHPFKKILLIATSVGKPLYLEPKMIYLVFLASIALFVGYLIFKQKRLIVGFITIMLGYNIFLTATHVFGWGQPDLATLSSQSVEYYKKNYITGGNVYADTIINALPIASVLQREIGQQFSIYPVKETKDKIERIFYNDHHVTFTVNLFTPVPIDQKPLYEYIKQYGSGYVFFLNYLSKEYNIGLPIMDKYCEKKEEWKSVGNINAVVYYCSY